MHGSEHNLPLSEQIKRAQMRWIDLHSAASLLEDTKSAVLSQWMVEANEKSVARAELIVKASLRWQEHIRAINKARKAADIAKAELDYMRHKLTEWQSEAADERLRSKL